MKEHYPNQELHTGFLEVEDLPRNRKERQPPHSTTGNLSLQIGMYKRLMCKRL